MLIRFSVENYRSFKDRQVFSMIAAKHTRHPSHVINIGDKRILKGSFIFGANASGKSNFVKAISFARRLVMVGLKPGNISKDYFRIDSEYVSKPGVFQFDYYTNQKYYSYGFAISYESSEVLSEWLIELTDKNQERVIFERNVEKGINNVESDIKFSSNENQVRFDIYSKDVPLSRLLLRELRSKDFIRSEEFADITAAIKWFSNLIIVLPETKVSSSYDFEVEEYQNRHDSYLRYFDTGIIRTKYIDMPLEEVLSNKIPASELKDFIEYVEKELFEKNKKKYVNLNFGDVIDYKVHMKDGKVFASVPMHDHGNNLDLFSMNDESDGTRRLFELLPILEGDADSRIFIIDELDRSFHSKLVIEFIEKFYANANDKTQIIATLHDTNLMDFEILRQDEIWFIRKDTDNGAFSEMYSLNKFNIRFDKKIMKDYLLGRFGAIPFFSQDFEPGVSED